MNITVINGSPKGKNSITVQTAYYLEKRFPDHQFTYFDVGQRIRSYEKDCSEVFEGLKQADLILFVYPIYTFLAPYQLHRFVELMAESGIDISGKCATQITTSKHFFDVTAHNWMEEICSDFNLKFLKGLSADMEDLLEPKGRDQAEHFFEKILFDISHDIYQPPIKYTVPPKPAPHVASLPTVPKTKEKDVVMVTNMAPDDVNLAQMIADFTATFPYEVRIVNLRDYPFSGGCLGCMRCSTTEKCIYKDNFDVFLREEVQNGDALIYAFTIQNHFTHSSMKCYDDRQFCNGHRTVTHGMPVGYLISGNYQNEQNLKVLVEARSDVGGLYLAGVATDEGDTAHSISSLSHSLHYALNHCCERPKTFYGVGGTKIFRDLIYLMQGMMKADHKYYKQNGIYDFPHNNKGKMLQMKIIGSMLSMPSVQKKIGGQLSGYIVSPYTKLIDSAQPKAQQTR
ncbi:MAG: NAD(P)H-dependent oxidoreductase [Eubacteriales bacterium]